jgi:folate-binding protein YgfZ
VAALAVDIPDSSGSSVRTGIITSVPESPQTDHHAPTGSPVLCRLEDFGVLRFVGADARKFLQGQLSNDLARLSPGTILRAGLHNPQGRTVALLWLAARAENEILAVLPRELAETVASQLRKYLLRSKLLISDESVSTALFGAWAHGARSGPAQGWALADDRAVLIADAQAPEPATARMTREQWRALDIAAGQPQVYAATSAQFVAQMLNLDCIDAVSFTKGCYTGQEVIARAHYRGRVKRRMQRFESLQACVLNPGDSGRLADGRAYRVVEALQRPDGCCEFLAVAPLPEAVTEPSAVADDRASGQPLGVRALPLPYEIA